MFANDLLQSQLSLGAYSGATNPFSSPYTINAAAFNPLANPWQTNPLQIGPQTGGISAFGTPGGAPNYGAIAQQLQQQQQLQQLQQLASILASQGAIPQLFGVSPQNNPWQNQQQPNVFQNPLVNPFVAQQLALQAGSVYGQPQYMQPQYGQLGSVFGQQSGSPFAQTPFNQAPFAQGGYQLAPQSWVGQQIPGQIHPHHLSQLAARGLY